MFTDIICSLSSIGRMRHIIPIWLKGHCFNRLKVTPGYRGNGCNRFLTKWMAWIHCWPMTWTLPNASPKSIEKSTVGPSLPKMSSPYANSKDPNMSMHEADANMSKHGARFHQKKSFATGDARGEEGVGWNLPRSVGALDAEMTCWMVHVVEEWFFTNEYRHIEKQLRWKSNSTHFFHRWIMNPLKRYTYSIESTRSSVTDIYKPQKVAWPVAYAASKTACRITSHRDFHNTTSCLANWKQLNCQHLPLINAGCSRVRPQHVSTNLVLKKITCQWITARWMHYYWY